jgi:hypothetical protein
MDSTELYCQLLGLTTPWTVVRVLHAAQDWWSPLGYDG